MSNDYTVENKSTGKEITLEAIGEESALGTVYILEEESGKQQHMPSWYRRKMLIIDTSPTEYLLVLGKWSIKVEKENEQ